jgi:tRNA-(ms[2]io[6]A)-hydroxylase
MLRLAEPSGPSWAAAAAANLPELLHDHAHCEKKAASTAINLIFRYPDHTNLVRALTDLAREEFEHFQMVLDVMDARGIPYGRFEPSPYAGKLMKAVRRGEPDRLVDTLLCCALIEARSCERMKQLSETLPDPELRTFYGDLLASEARHHQMYVDLAAEVAPRDAVHARLAELASHEASVLQTSPLPLRMHSGHGSVDAAA